MSGWVWGALMVAVPSVAGVVKYWLKLRFLRYLAKQHGPNGALIGAEAIRRTESAESQVARIAHDRISGRQRRGDKADSSQVGLS
jgi:hypothetical protein